MEWTEQAPDVVFGTLTDWSKKLTILEYCSLFSGSKIAPFVHFSVEIRRQIFCHLNEGNTELGGIMLGKVFRMSPDPKSRVVLVEVIEALASENFNSTGVSLKMDTEVWDRARLRIGGIVNVVGWYHSHPNLGAFFSGTDRRTQAAVFHHDYSLGLVIDPLRVEEKWFAGPNSVEISSSQIKGF